MLEEKDNIQNLVRLNHGVVIGNNCPLTVIAGPCQLESRQHAFDMAGTLQEITRSAELPFIYKTSFDKANRTSLESQRGLGLEKSLEIFLHLKHELDILLLTDVHEKEQCQKISQYVDILQIPAFLCRQTDLIIEAAKTGKVINVKKGQFLAPWDMENVINKITSTQNKKILLTERGVCFGYNALINDMRALPIMAQFGYPVVFDATHSVQQPGGLGDKTSGERWLVPYLARAAVAVGVAAIFMEVHHNPDRAPSDGSNMITIETFHSLVHELKSIDILVKKKSNE